ncbi:hypothetical protein M2302_006153 [Micromonospora sp. A200]|nr:hypothetical protein [Micromonospora sp. A200]
MLPPVNKGPSLYQRLQEYAPPVVSQVSTQEGDA